MDAAQRLADQRQAILDGDVERAAALAEEALAAGMPPTRSIDEGFVPGIEEVGRLWAEGEFFLPELVQGADAMKAAMAVLRPALLQGDGAGDERPLVVLGTVAGDIHDIGKSLVGTVLEANGYSVHDLGRDVPDEQFVAAVAERKPALLGLSALLTTTMTGQARVIETLNERGLRETVSVMVGGAPVNAAFAESIGADGYAANAMEALALARRLQAARR